MVERNTQVDDTGSERDEQGEEVTSEPSDVKAFTLDLNTLTTTEGSVKDVVSGTLLAAQSTNGDGKKVDPRPLSFPEAVTTQLPATPKNARNPNPIPDRRVEVDDNGQVTVLNTTSKRAPFGYHSGQLGHEDNVMPDTLHVPAAASADDTKTGWSIGALSHVWATMKHMWPSRKNNPK